MADWKQITARIRRARTSKDPAGQLTNLFSKTRDAMVAFELARYFETSGNSADAGRWYLTAAERFRRADWKTKAQESATRLGATEPAEIPEPVRAKAAEVASEANDAETPVQTAESSAEPETDKADSDERAQPVNRAEREASAVRGGQRQKRGRRSGREPRTARREQPREGSRGAAPEARTADPARAEAIPSRAIAAEPESPPEVTAATVPSLRGRFGDPGLTSRLMQLEMNFRRLLGATPTPLEAADKAPAGPGVWVLTDSDLTTYYYVEPCQTLRVAIPNLLRGGSSRKGESIRPKLAEHLGIPEAKVGKYLSEHCVVRWLQMDDDAAHFAHFLIAVLRPALNE
jgi:hypothetical protein